MTRLSDASPEFDEPAWRSRQRAAALEAFRTEGLPDPADEVWHYAPLDKLDLDQVELAVAPDAATLDTAVGGRAPSAVVAVVAGALLGVRLHPAAAGLRVTAGPVEGMGALVGADDAFASLNLALTPGPIVLDVDASCDAPIVLLVECPPGASFPRLLVRVADGASARILEHVTGPGAALVVGVAEYVVGARAELEVCSVQSLGAETWSIARTRASIGSGATFTQAVVGLGGRYDRVRADALLDGDDATSVLDTAHVGTRDQVHDLRTMQVHRGRRTVSRLRSKAAVAGHAGSIYSGLISMRAGAKRAKASQVNTSLVLSDDAYADAVPNLDIDENDVQCTHASTVGPVDAEQRWYLESRGVAPDDAVQLILEGFFADVEQLLDDAVLGGCVRDAISGLDASAGAGTDPGTA